ncbi:MAG: DUF1343 domain-containing protein [Bacteroides sp.]|nr:DUF1343 domain-containing protein [Bacteroides sp.]MCM1413519.1 DUF1343 domain-containing protein [Bacteroides sp.]MCM1471073.1 DUF1343 domain-containing protein [Bacteroides sp.]
MKLIKIITIIVGLLIVAGQARASEKVTVGAERTDLYLPMLKGKRVALLSNHTGVVSDGRHTLDLLLDNGVNVVRIFSPEHGFRGTADAGENVSGSTDSKTGLPIVSLYGKQSVPTASQLADVDVVISDLQDVGLRFYTYYITMLNLMDAAADADKQFVIFDRPNPNGMTVDGPILDMSLASGVGKLPITTVHGMTLGELGRMIVGEGWLKSSRKLDLTVIPCDGYTHSTRYELPVAPSPNLPDMRSVYLYPSTCLFEGTVMSLGRGTDMPFEVYGHPNYSGSTFSFTPRSRPGAKNPPLLGRKCYGRDLRNVDLDHVIESGIDISYVVDAYRNIGMKRVGKFFTTFFDKLIGNRRVRQMIEEGRSAEEIKKSWAADVAAFKRQRQPYLLYPL